MRRKDSPLQTIQPNESTDQQIPGVNHDVYWNNNFTLIQLEDIMDIANVMLPQH